MRSFVSGCWRCLTHRVASSEIPDGWEEHDGRNESWRGAFARRTWDSQLPGGPVRGGDRGSMDRPDAARLNALAAGGWWEFYRQSFRCCRVMVTPCVQPAVYHSARA